MGRFINKDPIGLAGGHNLYAFVGNNPLNSWDVRGLQGAEISESGYMDNGTVDSKEFKYNPESGWVKGTTLGYTFDENGGCPVLTDFKPLAKPEKSANKSRVLFLCLFWLTNHRFSVHPPRNHG